MALTKLDYICGRMKLDFYLSLYIKINTKWVKDMNLRPEDYEIVRRKYRGNISRFSTGNDFLDKTTPEAQTKAKLNKCAYIKLRSFCTAKEMLNSMKRHPTEWEKIFAGYLSNKGLKSRMLTQKTK